MIESPELLRSYIRGIRRLSGASSVALYVPTLPGGLFQPILLHDGEAPPVPELENLESAEQFVLQWAENRPTEVQAALGLVASTARDCGLVPLPGVELTWELARFGGVGQRRRRTDNDSTVGEGEFGAWIGLRFQPGQGSVLEQLAKSDLPSRLQEDRDPSRWWDWLFVLGGALASHTSQVSAILKDPVTGLADRKAFQAVLTDHIERALEEAKPLTLLLINPDQFAVVNERFGRELGDRCVREISERLRPALRITDLVARYGGVVFAAILVDTPEDEANEVAQRVQSQLGSGPYLDGDVELGFSIGIGALDSPGEGVVGPLDVVRRADLALNAAKRLGGNSVVSWQDTPDEADSDGLDRLSGIFTGNMAKDYRNMALLRDTIDIVALDTAFDGLAADVVEKLYSAFTPDRIGILTRDPEGEINLVHGLTRRESSGGLQSRVETLDLEPFEVQQIEETLAGSQAREIRHPELGREVADHRSGRASYVAPLTTGGRDQGCLFVEGRRDVLTLDSADLIFLESLAAQVAVALDRARLTELETARQEQERRRLRAELSELRQALQHVKMVYRSPQMEELVATVNRVAPTDATVLITGESGTGKELLARTLHELSQRKDKSFVIVDCGAIASTLIESELFGHERGAYTGAQTRRTGRLVEASGGTVVLDEIGELPLEVQSKLLRFVQDKQLTPVGGSRAQTVDVRIVAATNRDLSAEVTAGRFREDLFHRLNVVRLDIPPLRERPDDVIHLARHFLELFAVQYHKGLRHFSPEAEKQMARYSWPGNVRELQNRVLKSVILSDSDSIGPADLGFETPAGSATTAATVALSGDYPDLGPSGVVTVEGSWEELRLEMGHQIDLATQTSPPLRLPLGTWLRDDLLLAAAEASQEVAREAAGLVGMPESTYRRRLRSARDLESSGLATRSEGWESVRQILRTLTRSSGLGKDLHQRVQAALLEEILARFPNDVRTGAQLLGVSAPTYRRRARELSIRA